MGRAFQDDGVWLANSAPRGHPMMRPRRDKAAPRAYLA
jgi:hypothetical protein